MKHYIFTIALVFVLLMSHAQSTIPFWATVIDAETKEALIGATLQLENLEKGGVTNLEGKIAINDVPIGKHKIHISYTGYDAIDTTIKLTLENNTFVFALVSDNTLDEITVNAVRSTRTFRDIPTRIEFIGEEELEEKAIMNAANISVVLRESSGIQMQQSSLSSGNSSIRIQGLDGRYTQLLKDGFPLFSGFSGGLSLMQIPPLDLAQFEIIKGSSSTLYGGDAIAGLVNMTSKTPSDETKLEILLAQTHAGASNGNIFYADKKGKFGFTVYGAGSYQKAYNPDSDNFTNLPLSTTFSINPKIFYYPNKSSVLWFGINANTDNRKGGDIHAVKNGVSNDHTYIEKNSSNRVSTQFVYEADWENKQKVTFKNSVSFFDRKLSLPSYTFQGTSISSFTEFSYLKNTQLSEWNLGLNIYTENFEEENTVMPRNDDAQTFGVFANNITDISSKLILETGFRLDYNLTSGFFALPRISLLWKANQNFSSRIGGGMGYKLPDMFTEEASAINYENISPISPALDAEKSYGFNLDFSYKQAIGEELFFSINQLFYATHIQNSLLLVSKADHLVFINADDIMQSIGSETNLKFSYKDFNWFINYAYIDTQLKYKVGNPTKPLTAKHNAGTTLIYENEQWRIGYEAYYTGSQYLLDGSKTQDFFTMGFFMQRHFRWASPYINFENFTDRRQNRFSPEVLGTLQNPQFQPIYAPTDGFILTMGVHVKPLRNDTHKDEHHGCHRRKCPFDLASL